MWVAGRGGRALPVIASLDHLPCEGEVLCAGSARGKGSSRSGELAELARPEGLLPLAITRNFNFIPALPS